MRTYRASQSPSAGFTLVELMMVCTLIMIQAAVSIPIVKVYQIHVSNKAALRTAAGVRTESQRFKLFHFVASCNPSDRDMSEEYDELIRSQ